MIEIKVGDVVYTDDGSPSRVLDANWYHETWGQARLIVETMDSEPVIQCPMDFAAVVEVERNGVVIWFEGEDEMVQLALFADEATA